MTTRLKGCETGRILILHSASSLTVIFRLRHVDSSTSLLPAEDGSIPEFMFEEKSNSWITGNVIQQVPKPENQL